MLIDAHAHLLPRDYPADAPECFPRMDPIDGETARLLIFGQVRFKARDVFFDAERRVEAMDESGVDAEVLTPMPPLLRYDLPVADGARPGPVRQRVRRRRCARRCRSGCSASGWCRCRIRTSPLPN